MRNVGRRGRWVVMTALVTSSALVASACGTDVGVSQGPSRPLGESGVDPAPGTDDPAGDPDPTDPAPDEPSTTTEPSPSPGSEPAPPVTDPDGPFVPAPIEWEPFDGRTDVAVLDVPIDYADPTGGTIELFLARHRALDDDRTIGSLLVNPGGPGFGGSDYALFAPQLYDQGVLSRFDIIGWDPRGTGESDPAIDCVDDYDRFFGSSDAADDEAAFSEAISREFAAECQRNNADIIEHVGTNNSARDIDTIRRALDEDAISYLGFSYGSELGAVWATLFPDTVRAAVLDGAADPTADALEGRLQQWAGFEASLDTFLAECSADSSCAFHNDGDAGGAFDRLLVDLAETPIPSEPGRPLVGRSIATSAVLQAMYNEFYWPSLEAGLADAQAGDGSGLLALHDSYFQRRPDGTWGNELEAFQVIECADSPERPTAEELAADIPRFVEVAPRLVPPDATPSFSCTFFAPASDPRVDVTGAGAGPIVVMGTTGDPTTPLESSRTMARTLEDGRLIVVESNNHGAYFSSSCARDIVTAYLVDLTVPADGTECR